MKVPLVDEDVGGPEIIRSNRGKGYHSTVGYRLSMSRLVILVCNLHPPAVIQGI